ncbi:MAG: MazG-like family protein [Eubacteriales bacterium]|nr:MazG-like family protein [Eubacteriales bacterium]
MDTKATQERIYRNKVDHNFNTTDIPQEFCYLYGEVGEAYQAWLKKKPDFGEELADVAIYLLGLAQITGVDLGREIEKKMTVNEMRYYTPDGEKHLKP